jgi:hypothetical protein
LVFDVDEDDAFELEDGAVPVPVADDVEEPEDGGVEGATDNEVEGIV